MPWMLPHPPLVWEQVRPNDIWLLLGLGAGYELICRFFLLMFVKCKSSKEQEREALYQKVSFNTHQKRKLGPSAFVETSKLERQLLSLERELDAMYEVRITRRQFYEKMLLKYGNNIMQALVFFLYYGTPIATVGEPYTYLMEGDGNALGSMQQMMALVDDPATAAEKSWKMLLFPISYIGLGVKISKWGMDADIAATSISALLVFWSAQVTMGQIMDALDALFLS